MPMKQHKHKQTLAYFLTAVAALLALSVLGACAAQAGTPPLPEMPDAASLDPTPTLVYLVLPTVTPTPGAPPSHAALAGVEVTAAEVAGAETVSADIAAAPESAPIEAAPASTPYTVQPGDTLLALAMRHGLPMAAIQLANRMGVSTMLYAGQTLELPAAEAWRGASPFWTVYEVLSGDTVIGIANKYGLDFVALVAVNELSNADVLHIGQPLILPLEVPVEIAARAAVAAVPPTSAPAATAPPAAAVAAASTPTPAPVAAAPPAAPPPSGITAPAEIAGWPGEVFALINAERAAAGLGPFRWNDTLAQAAYLHGLDCQQRGSCNHTGSDGSTVKMRVIRAGYPAIGAAECIVYSRTPQQAVFWWMDEVPPNDWHRRTILSTWVTEIGIAVVPNHLGSYYFIANFGRPQ